MLEVCLCSDGHQINGNQRPLARSRASIVVHAGFTGEIVESDVIYIDAGIVDTAIQVSYTNH